MTPEGTFPGLGRGGRIWHRAAMNPGRSLPPWPLFLVLLGTLGCQSEPTPVATTPRPAATPPASSPGTPVTYPDESVPAIARREVIRRQERVRQMDEAAIRASQAMAEDDLEGAVEGFRRAVDGLPQ